MYPYIAFFGRIGSSGRMPEKDNAHVVEALLGIQPASPRHRKSGYELLRDTSVQPIAEGIRSSAVSARQLLFRIGTVFVDVEIEHKTNSNRASLIGQLLDSSNPGSTLSKVPVVLLGRNRNIASTITNENGEFQFQLARKSNLKLSVSIHGDKPVHLPITYPPAKWEVVRSGSKRTGNPGAGKTSMMTSIEDCMMKTENQDTSISAVLLYEYPTTVKVVDTTYVVRVCGVEKSSGTWEGWLEFHPTEKSRPVLSTGTETTQPNRVAIDYWATGLGPIYLGGALARALGRWPD